MFVKKNPNGLPVVIKNDRISILNEYYYTRLTISHNGRIMFLHSDYEVSMHTKFIGDDDGVSKPIEVLELKMYPCENRDEENPYIVLQFPAEIDGDKIDSLC